jgi:hypothetical protein
VSNGGLWYWQCWTFEFCYYSVSLPAYLEARNKMSDLITSWIGILGPGWGPVLSSTVMITGGVATATTLPSPAQKYNLGSQTNTIQKQQQNSKKNVLRLQEVFFILLSKVAVVWSWPLTSIYCQGEERVNLYLHCKFSAHISKCILCDFTLALMFIYC